MGSNKVFAGGTTPKNTLHTIKFTTKKSPNGYQLNMSIPWTTLHIVPKAEHSIGFDVQINDDDNGNSRDAKISWNAKVDEAWKNPEVFGQIILRDDARNFINSGQSSIKKPIDNGAFNY